MITRDYCQLFARYNSWQNTSLVTAADQLSDCARTEDRGAFFGSIAATLNHLYWADTVILARLNGNERPQDSIAHAPKAIGDFLHVPARWEDYKALRRERDQDIESWAAGLEDSDLVGLVHWYPVGSDTRQSLDRAAYVMHLFNHQTHHRGQVHAMLTAAGIKPEDTDLPVVV